MNFHWLKLWVFSYFLWIMWSLFPLAAGDPMMMGEQLMDHILWARLVHTLIQMFSNAPHTHTHTWWYAPKVKADIVRDWNVNMNTIPLHSWRLNGPAFFRKPLCCTDACWSLISLFQRGCWLCESNWGMCHSSVTLKAEERLVLGCSPTCSSSVCECFVSLHPFTPCSAAGCEVRCLNILLTCFESHQKHPML